MSDLKNFDDITPDMYDDLNKEIEQIWDDGCHGDCGSCGSDCSDNPNKYPEYATILLAVTGSKGGVGKSTVTALLAYALRRRGLKVGVLDADIPGASMPLLLGAKGPVKSEGSKISPVVTGDGIELLSYNLIADNLSDPVLWPGADTFNVVNYLYTSGSWSDLDVMLIDMPSGAGDIAINLLTAFPVSGSIVVGEDSELCVVPTQRCVNMCRMFMSSPYAYVENKSLDGEVRLANRYDLGDNCTSLALPLDPELASGDHAVLTSFRSDELEELAGKIAEAAATKKARREKREQQN